MFTIPIIRSLLALALLGATTTFASAQPGATPPPPNVYPNPFDQVLNILVPKPPGRLITVQLRDMHGNVMLHEQVSTMMNMQVNTSGVPPGLYVVNLIGQRGQAFHQQQVQKFPAN